MAVSNINGLLQQMAKDAVEKFGLKTAASKSTSQLTRMARYLRSHPNYPKVMRQVQELELPEFLLPMPNLEPQISNPALYQWPRAALP